MYTGVSPMSDWVGTMYSQEIWSKIRGAVVVANRMPTRTIPDGYASDIIPLESTDPVFYKVAEAAATDSTLRVPDATVTSSAAATAKKTVTLGKMGARVLYSGEAVEDSIIAFVPQLRAQLEKQGAEQLEHVIVDGDVDLSANTNINDITSTPDGDETYLLFDGFRKLALLGNSAANARSAAGGFVVEDFLATLQLLGVAGVAGLDPRQTAFIVDYNTYYAALNLAELKTQDTFRMATLENGALTSIYNRDVLPSFQMHLEGRYGLRTQSQHRRKSRPDDSQQQHDRLDPGCELQPMVTGLQAPDDDGSHPPGPLRLLGDRFPDALRSGVPGHRSQRDHLQRGRLINPIRQPDPPAREVESA